MTIFVDTSVWSLAFRRDVPGSDPHATALSNALTNGEIVLSTGLVLQELLQGFHGPKSEQGLLERFDDVQLIEPSVVDYIHAAQLRNHCRRSGVQVGTVDALIAQLCISNSLELLAADRDFSFIARFSDLKVIGFDRPS